MQWKECILRGSVKDNENRIHPCIVHSTAKLLLDTLEYMENDRAKWDEYINNPNADPLDTLSLQLHRCFKKICPLTSWHRYRKGSGYRGSGEPYTRLQYGSP